ncbi:hypothetical protein RND71_025529 [Anisodus tanguticus]|uniref:Uncharacterized protein n=1 Tax=Anisodus tanguticus TaxID=243964 RepID=A0AAE1V4X6_9SOLA|nr:hypothetical protein RND71_025529 [Anisodus tanguticus]
MSNVQCKTNSLIAFRQLLIPTTLDTQWYSKLTKLLGNFSHSKAIELSCNFDKFIYIDATDENDKACCASTLEMLEA